MSEPIYQTRVTISDQERADLALGVALRAALATLDGREQVLAVNALDAWLVNFRHPVAKPDNDATRALRAALLAPPPVAVRDETPRTNG